MSAVAWSWRFDGNRAVAATFEEVPEPPIKDAYWQRLLKAVPVQAVGFITAADAIAQGAATEWRTLALAAVFVFGLLLGYLEMTRQRRAPLLETGVALAAYVIWTYAQGGVFAALGWHQPVIGGLFALAFASLLPFLPTAPEP